MDKSEKCDKCKNKIFSSPYSCFKGTMEKLGSCVNFESSDTSNKEVITEWYNGGKSAISYEKESNKDYEEKKNDLFVSLKVLREFDFGEKDLFLKLEQLALAEGERRCKKSLIEKIGNIKCPERCMVNFVVDKCIYNEIISLIKEGK